MPEQLATTRTCRLRLVEIREGEVVDLVDFGRVTHEAPPAEWFEALEDVDVGEAWFTVELWIESAKWRWLLDSRVVERDVADALLEGELDDRLRVALSTSVA